MKVLIIGANGQVGWELVRQAKQQGLDVLAVALPGFDITNARQVADTINLQAISLVVNASAYTAVDKAESEKELAFAVNRDGPRNLARACTAQGIPLIHISTDYVFDGTQKRPYLETDPLSPLGTYGKSKAAGEETVRELCGRHVIIRTAWVYGVHGHNFVKTMLKIGKTNETLRVVDDQMGCPTFAADIAESILKIVHKMAHPGQAVWGTFHYCGSPGTTWFKFAREIFSYGKKKTALSVNEVIPITTEEYPTPARRPEHSVLDCRLIQEVYDIQPYLWRDRLHVMLDRLFD